MTLHRTLIGLTTVCWLAGCAGLTTPAAPPAEAAKRSSKPSAITTNPPPAGTASAGRVGLPQIGLSTINGARGQSVRISATLRSGSKGLAGTQNDIGFDPHQIAIAAKSNGKPDCAANAALGKEGTAFSFLPAGCQKSGSCSSVRALVLSLSNVSPLPDNAVLYTCNLHVAADARLGAHPLSISHVGFSSPTGEAINGTGSNGSVTLR